MKRRGAGSLSVDDVGTRVRLAAWVQKRRDLGGLLFLDLRDRSGVAQVVVYPEQAEALEALEPVRQEWVVEIEATTFEAFDAYWIERGWAEDPGPIKTTSRIDASNGRPGAIATSVQPCFRSRSWRHLGLKLITTKISSAS